MKTFQEIIAPLSEEDKSGLSHHMRIVMLGCYICDGNLQEAYEKLLDSNPNDDASDHVVLWEPLEGRGFTVNDLLDMIE